MLQEFSQSSPGVQFERTNVSLVVLTSGLEERLQSLSLLLHSISGQTSKGFEVIIACETYGDDLLRVLQESLVGVPYKVVCTAFWNKCKTANFVLRRCSSEFIFLLEDDLVLDENFVKVLLNTLGESEDFGCVYSKCIWMTTEGLATRAGPLSAIARYLSALRVHDSVLRARGRELGGRLRESSVFTMSVACRRRALFDAGLYDESVKEPILGEDFDLALRVRKAGYRIILDQDTASYHYTRQVTKTTQSISMNPRFIMGRNLSEVYFVAKNGDVYGFAIFPHYVYRVLESVAWGIRSRRPLALLLGFVGASQGLVKGLAAQHRQTRANPPLGGGSA